MHLAHSRRIAVLAAMLACTPLAASPLAGTYVRSSTPNGGSGSFTLKDVTGSQALIDLQVAQRNSRDPTACCLRTGALSQEPVVLSGDMALYREASTEPTACALVFAFDRTGARVTQFGQCALFGVGVDASGRYLRRAAPGISR